MRVAPESSSPETLEGERKTVKAPAELLLDRALASIEHLSEVALPTTRRMDELLNA